MRKNKIAFCLLLINFLFSNQIFAKVSDYLDYPHFETFVAEMSLKVNLFKELWKVAPEIEFFGGTTRDFSFFILGELEKAKNKEDFNAIVERLRSLPEIDVKAFLFAASDVDAISENDLPLIDPQQFGIKKLDKIKPERFDPKSAEGLDEINQGFIPAEKIRLKKSGFIKEGNFGSGLKEIYEGNLSIFFSDAQNFQKTKFSIAKENHPILLALRYIRLLGINYLYRYGKSYPKTEILFKIDPKIEKKLAQIFQEARETEALSEFLKEPRFVYKINETIKKIYLSHTNSMAANLLMHHFKVQKLSRKFAQIKPVDQYVFAVIRDEEVIAQNLTKANIDPKKFYEPTEKLIPNLKMYHGTSSEEGFRAIILEGVRPSENGSVGSGIYVASENDKATAIRYAKNDANKVIEFDIAKTATVVDLRDSKYAKEIFEKSSLDYDQFAEKFGIDIFRYSFGEDAYVIKNPAVISNANGYQKKLLDFSKTIEITKEKLATKNQLNEIFDFITSNHLSPNEEANIYKMILDILKGKSAEELEQILPVAATPAKEKGYGYFLRSLVGISSPSAPIAKKEGQFYTLWLEAVNESRNQTFIKLVEDEFYQTFKKDLAFEFFEHLEKYDSFMNNFVDQKQNKVYFIPSHNKKGSQILDRLDLIINFYIGNKLNPRGVPYPQDKELAFKIMKFGINNITKEMQYQNSGVPLFWDVKSVLSNVNLWLSPREVEDLIDAYLNNPQFQKLEESFGFLKTFVSHLGGEGWEKSPTAQRILNLILNDKRWNNPETLNQLHPSNSWGTTKKYWTDYLEIREELIKQLAKNKAWINEKGTIQILVQIIESLSVFNTNTELKSYLYGREFVTTVENLVFGPLSETPDFPQILEKIVTSGLPENNINGKIAHYNYFESNPQIKKMLAPNQANWENFKKYVLSKDKGNLCNRLKEGLEKGVSQQR